MNYPNIQFTFEQVSFFFFFGLLISVRDKNKVFQGLDVPGDFFLIHLWTTASSMPLKHNVSQLHRNF